MSTQNEDPTTICSDDDCDSGLRSATCTFRPDDPVPTVIRTPDTLRGLDVHVVDLRDRADRVLVVLYYGRLRTHNHGR